MKPVNFLKCLPAGSPAAELLKIVVLIAGTVFVDKLGEFLKEGINVDNYSKIIDIKREDV